jgi:HK97 gp10 family phage protein
MKITGAGKHRRRLSRMRGRELVLELSKQVYIAADRVRGEAQFLIAKGSIQGKGHQPSKPGEPPNLDTGVLSAGITARLTGSLKAVAESAAPYAAHLEYGTSKMAERPYMRPAAKTVRKDYQVNVARAVSRINRKG